MTAWGSYLHADRTVSAELALYGRFQQVPKWLYFRREHAGQLPQTVRDRCTTLDPRRANRLRHPAVRLYGEYLWAYISMINHGPCRRPTSGSASAIWLIGWGPELSPSLVEGCGGSLSTRTSLDMPPIRVAAVVPGLRHQRESA